MISLDYAKTTLFILLVYIVFFKKKILFLLCIFIRIFVQLLSLRPNVSSLNNTEGLFVTVKAVCNQHDFIASSLGAVVI